MATFPFKSFPRLDKDALPHVSAAREVELRKKFPHLPAFKDLYESRKEAFLRFPALENWCAKNLLYDSRDGIMVSLILNIWMCAVPMIVLLYKYPSHWLGFCVYMCNFVLWLQRFILMMHYSEHRQLFKAGSLHLVGQYLLPVAMCPIFGIPPGMYHLHHVAMHHVENNVFNEDLSSTEPYQRDNFGHFVIYYLRYYTHLILLPVYAIRKSYYKLAIVSTLGSAAWMGAIVYGCSTNFIFTLWAGIVPGLVTGGALMFGNFSQHIFVHPDIEHMEQNLKSYPYNCALSLQSMNHFENQYAFNDGYHITHHINSRIHWTDMPKHFLDNLETYAENNALIFDGLGFFDIGLHVFMGWWDGLADHYVHLSKEKKTKEEVIANLKLRCTPILRKNRRTHA